MRAALRSPRRLRIEVVAGLVVALALIPEAISFSIIAGVDPRLGLFASFTMAVSIAFLGGRPAMISAATGAVALVIAPVAREHGIEYFIATVILAGVFQVLLGVAGVAKMMRLVPRSVMVGFVNSLAILIFLAQLPHMVDVPLLVYQMIAAGILMMVLLPRLTDVVPAPLVAIVVITDTLSPGTLRRMPKSETVVMLSTVVVVVATHNLAIGVVLGVLVAMTLFARRVAHLTETHREIVQDPDGTQKAVYTVTGELFFASSNDLPTQFEYAEDPDRVVIDLSASHVWDASTVASLDAIVTKYERMGKSVEIVGQNEASADRHGRLTGQLSTH